MCGRTSLFVPWPVLEERFDAEAAEPLAPRYNVAPREDLAVVRNDDPDAIRLHEWGLVPRWADDPAGTRFVNARAETIEERPSFREAAASRRCLVLADGFYEWHERATDRQPYRVEREDGEPFAMAGLFERWTDDGHDRELTTVAVVTTEPNEVVARLHDRMAAVLRPDDERAWLEADDPDERAALLGTPPADDLHAYPVSKAVDDPANDSPAVVEPVERADDPQTGLDEFS